MNHTAGPIVGVIARGGATDRGASPVAIVDPASPTWANEFFASLGASSSSAVLFVPMLERSPVIGQGTQLDELLPDRSPQVAVVTLPTHVTGVLAALQDCASTRPDRARFVAAVRAHAERSHAGVWLRRVGKLEHPSPSLAQQVRGWNPFDHGQFAELHPAFTVRSKLQPLPDQAPRVLRTSGELPPQSAEALRAAYTPVHTETLTGGHRLAARWGTDNAVEYAVTPEPARLVLPDPDGACPNCGDPVWGPCPFCHLTRMSMDNWHAVVVPGVTTATEEELRERLPQLSRQSALVGSHAAGPASGEATGEQDPTTTLPQPPQQPPAESDTPPREPALRRVVQLPRSRRPKPPPDNPGNTGNPWLPTDRD